MAVVSWGERWSGSCLVEGRGGLLLVEMLLLDGGRIVLVRA